MDRSYWRALGRQVWASLHGPLGFATTVIGLAGVTATGIYASLGNLHGWAPVAITAAVVLVLANYVGFQAWRGQHVAIDQARALARGSTAFREHVDDLYGWADAASKTLEWPQQRFTVDMTDPLARYFADHYPDAAAAVREINDWVLERDDIVRRFTEAAETLAATVPGRAVPECATFLRWVGKDPVQITDDDWQIGDGVAVIVQPPGLGRSYLIAEVGRTSDAEHALEMSKTAAALMWKEKASAALRTLADDKPPRKRARDALRDAMLDRDPPNDCPRCRPILSGQR